jgi:hypothetical protein
VHATNNSSSSFLLLFRSHLLAVAVAPDAGRTQNKKKMKHNTTRSCCCLQLSPIQLQLFSSFFHWAPVASVDAAVGKRATLFYLISLLLSDGGVIRDQVAHVHSFYPSRRPPRLELL